MTSAMKMFCQNAPQSLVPERGKIYLHRHYLDPDMSNKPLACKVTKIAQGVAYYRPYYGLHDDGSEWLGSPAYVPVESFGSSFVDVLMMVRLLQRENVMTADKDCADYLRLFTLATHGERPMNIDPRRFWFACREDARYELGFGDRGVAVFEDRFIVQWITQTLNNRIAEDECKVTPA